MPREWDEHGNLVTTGPAKREWDERGNLITGAAPSPHEGGMPAGTMQAQPGGPLFHYTKPQDLWSTTKRQVGGGLEAIGELGKGLGQTVLGAAKAYVGGPQEGAQFAQSMIAPQQAQFQRGRETTGLESAGHYLAGATPFVGPMAAEAGESIGRGEVGRGLVYGAAAIGPEKIVSMMRPAVDLVRTGDAITNGMTRLAKEQVRPTLDKFEGAVKAEVSRHADAVVNADEARGARGSRILVNTEDAAKAAEAKAATMKGSRCPRRPRGSSRTRVVGLRSCLPIPSPAPSLTSRKWRRTSATPLAGRCAAAMPKTPLSKRLSIKACRTRCRSTPPTWARTTARAGSNIVTFMPPAWSASRA